MLNIAYYINKQEGTDVILDEIRSLCDNFTSTNMFSERERQVIQIQGMVNTGRELEFQMRSTQYSVKIGAFSSTGMQGFGRFDLPLHGYHWYCEFHDDIQNGIGRHVDQSHFGISTYVGEIQNGERQGRGRFSFRLPLHNVDQYVVEGEFDKSNVSGLGKLTKRNGEYYIGQFNQGQFCGFGQFYSAKFQYAGQFKDSEYNGRGIYQNVDGYVLEGDWVNNSYYKYEEHEKHCVYLVPDVNSDENDEYAINWRSTRSKDRSEMQCKSTYGNGVVKFGNGSVYEGTFIDGKFNGHGKLLEANGQILEGEFYHGKFVSKK